METVSVEAVLGLIGLIIIVGLAGRSLFSTNKCQALFGIHKPKVARKFLNFGSNYASYDVSQFAFAYNDSCPLFPGNRRHGVPWLMN